MGKTFTVKLYSDKQKIDVYKGVKEFHTKDEGRQLVFIRATGQEVFTNLKWEAIEE